MAALGSISGPRCAQARGPLCSARSGHSITYRRTCARAHSGNPAFRRPSINSFKCDCLRRPILADIVKAGSVSSRRAAASRASPSRPRWAKADARQKEAGGNEGFWRWAFFPATMASSKRRSSIKAIPIPTNIRCSRGSTGLVRMARSKLRIASSGSPAILKTWPLLLHAKNELGLSATARLAISISRSQSPTMNAEIMAAIANVSGSPSSMLNAKAKKPNCFLPVELRIDSIAKKDPLHVTDTCQSRDQAELRVQLQGAMSQPDRLGQPFAGR